MTAVATKLREARALIERGWVQTTYACATTGKQEAFATASMARSMKPWSAGALDDCQDATTEYEEMLARAIGYDPLFTARFMNGTTLPERTQADVLAAFDRAIELAEQEAR
jgi:hypothetical protein